MPKIKELIKEHRYEELWQTCCGFIDLNLEQFMAIQKQLLLEQIKFLKECDLGKKILHGAMPSSVDEFRKQIPFTKYNDYCPELLEKREDCLPLKPTAWAHTSGRSGEYQFKWVPISPRAWDEMALLMYAAYIFATCRRKGDLSVRPKKFLYATAPAPYTVGIVAYKCEEEFGFKYFPSPIESEKMSFIERLDKGFWMALEEGIDGIYGLTAVLVSIGEKFKSGAGKPKLSSLIKHPRALLRLSKGLIKSKLAGRPMLPKDVWSIKGIACGGTDSHVFRNKVKEMWGVNPLDIYAGTEGLIVAMQTWDFEGMTFTPHLNFLEFIPEAEYFKGKADPSYQPKTVLLDEVKAGEIYELALTNLHGGIMTRYRPGDMIKITALENKGLSIKIPQMVFERRADDLIDLGIIRLTEKVIWKAIENTNIPYVDWTARKEVVGGKPVLFLRIELKDTNIIDDKVMSRAIYEEIKKLNDGFIHYDLASLEKLTDYMPIVTAFLPKGTFQNYMLQRQAEGADIANLKPPHINPSDKVLGMLGINTEPGQQTNAKRTMSNAKVAIR